MIITLPFLEFLCRLPLRPLLMSEDGEGQGEPVSDRAVSPRKEKEEKPSESTEIIEENTAGFPPAREKATLPNQKQEEFIENTL